MRSAMTSRSRVRPIWRRVAARVVIVTRAVSPTQSRKSRAMARASFKVFRTSWTRFGASSPGPGNCAAATPTDRTRAARQCCGQASERITLRRPHAERLGAFPQRTLLHLARRRLGNFGEDDVTRALIARQARPAPFDELFRRGAMIRLHLDESAGRFAPFVVGPRDHGHELDAWMIEQHVLDFDRGNVLAAGNNDILRAVLELHIAVLVLDAKGAGMEPAPSQRLLRSSLVLEVALHHNVAAEHHFTHRFSIVGH